MQVECQSCHEHRHASQMVPPSRVLPQLAERIEAKKPDWMADQDVCEMCLNEAMADDAEDMLMEEMQGDLTPLEREVIDRLRQGGMIAQNVADMDEGSNLTAGEKFAELVANAVGSFAFAGIVLVCVTIWLSITMNLGLMQSHPAIVFGGLSSALGALAAVQNPIILMSQRRAARRDRLRNENDYRINLKSELEVRYINAKLDYMLDKIGDLHREDDNKVS